MSAPEARECARVWDPAPVVDWLLKEGRLIPDPLKLVDALAQHLIDAGAPLWRLRFGLRTIHPLVSRWGYAWVRGRSTQLDRIGHGFEQTDAFIGSPAQKMAQTGAMVRYRLDRLDDDAHGLLRQIAAQGGTDYMILPMRFSDGSANLFTVTTDDAEGFSPCDIANFTRLVDVLAPVFETLAARRIAKTLLDTYLGPRTGGRVLAGSIQRGDGETIHAALWFSDLRDFTPLTETLPAHKLLDMLNAYFETVAASVTAYGGEILRFIGDAMLIVFPAEDEAQATASCRGAVDAALDAMASLESLNHRRRREGEPEIRFGVGLNTGEVIYGNVGAPERLDFTVMGPAVNRSARLESLTKTLGVPVLMSAEFAARLDRPVRSLGLQTMKGVAEPQEVFALEEHPARRSAAA